MDPVIVVLENNTVGAPSSHVCVGAVCATLLLATVFCAFAARKSRRAAREADEVVKNAAPIVPGARFVAGKVELAQGQGMAVEVTVTQFGNETQTKSGYSHTWKEVKRSIQVRPFYLRHESGTRIRVEPPQSVLLVDALDQMEWTAQNHRRRRAELVPGEEAVVEGSLQRGHDPEAMQSGGYRDAAVLGWVMKPAADGGMHISTEDLSRRHTLRARAFKKTLVYSILLGVLAQVPLVPYWTRVFSGEDVAATYVSRDMQMGRDRKGNRFNLPMIMLELGEGTDRRLLRKQIDTFDYAKLPEPGAKIWVRHVPGDLETTALGRGSPVSIIAFFFAAACAAVAVVLAWNTHRHRRWYEGKLVDAGQGRLPEPPMIRFTDVPVPDAPQSPAAPRKKKKKKRRPAPES